jgi:hypothetical protein
VEIDEQQRGSAGLFMNDVGLPEFVDNGHKAKL